VGEFFSFRPDWHQDDRAHRLVRQYQLTLDAILRDHPGLASCAVHCCHCGIRFLTHPRNANRQNVRCPFGCREHHRRQQANQRSKRHYRTDQGRRNKKLLNAKRSAAGGDTENRATSDAVQPDAAPADEDRSSSSLDSSPPTPHPAHPPTPVALQEAPGEHVKLMLEGFTLDEATLVNSPMLSYLAMVASLVEGHTIRREELLHALRRSMRQRSFDRLPRREYILRFLNQHPP